MQEREHTQIQSIQCSATVESLAKKTKTVIAAIIVSALVSISVQAVAADKQKELLIVTATRTERPISEVANTVTVIDADQIERELANDIEDLIRYEPGVSVDGSGRFGLNGFSIRGIGGDRVLTLVDGTPTADEFSFGPFLSSRRDFVDIDALKSVEIVRGPGSSVYGSNAIGGVVNFITKDPSDYLDGRAFAGSAKIAYGSVDDSLNTTWLGAFGNESLSGMIVGTYRDGSETETFFNDNSSGAGRRSENPQDNETTNIYSKFVYAPSDTQKLTFVAEVFDSESDTDIQSVAGTVSRGVITASQRGLDERDRERFSLNYNAQLRIALADSVTILAYYQQTDAEQLTLTELISMGQFQDRTRRSEYSQENSGVRLQLAKSFAIGSATHHISYGFDYDVSDTETLREGQTVNRADGSLAIEFSNFPTRDFPNSEYTSLGIFLQNEIELLDGRLRIIPAIRYDDFELDPTADAIYLSGNTGSPIPSGYDESEVSHKLGVIYDLTSQWSLYAQYAEGFRAPPLDAINTGFTNFAGGYTTLPNPDLRPESGETYEIGLRRTSDAGSVEFTVYRNDYDDFIEALASRGFNPATGLLEFQARNLDEAEIEGIEFKAQYDLSAFSDALEGFHLRAAYAYADGENNENKQPLNSVDPQQFVLGIAYRPANDKWSLEAIMTATDSKDANDIDATSLQSSDGSAVLPFETSGYLTLDLIGHYNFTDQARLNLGIYNLTDKQYHSWSEELVQDPATGNFDRLTEPGINVSASLKLDF